MVGFVEYFEAGDNCFLVLELCNEGDLENFIKTKPNNRIPEEEALEYFM